MPNCKQCNTEFEITDGDRKFYEKVNVPNPTLCPACRQQRRSCFRNERNFYKRKCDATGKEMISMYRPEAKAMIYSSKAWWGDDWDPLEYGRDFDFNRPFFEQFAELQKVVPRLSLYTKNVENCDYTNHVENVKNCYLSVDIAQSEDIYYGKYLLNCNNMVDCYETEDASECYEANYSPKSNNAKYIYLTVGGIDSDFLYNCRGVKNCLMCWNLRHKQYYIENKPYSKDEYKAYLKNYDTGSYKNVQKYLKHYSGLIKNAVRKASEIIKCEDCSGDYLHQCKNVQNTFNCYKMRDCSYCYDCAYMNDCLDIYESALDCELQYESHACNRGKFLIAASVCYDVNDLSYCEMCHNSGHLFGCIGLRHKKYCIFNKQYSKEEYFKLRDQIIEQMRKNDDWGEFFPVELSFFAYNESAAPEFSPMIKEEVLKRGWNWYEEEKEYQPQTYEIPDHIKDVPDSITDEILACSICSKNYRIISQELNFYHKYNIPIPRICPNCRYFERLKWRNPYKLYDRNCMKCDSPMKTTYSPDRPEKVYCEQCYLKTVY